MFEDIRARLKHAWNIFRARDHTERYDPYESVGSYSSYNKARPRLSYSAERTTLASVFTRMAMDVAAFDFNHVRVDKEKKYQYTMKSGLNTCLTLEANIDQTGRAFILDVVLSLFDEGCVAIVPVETSASPEITGSYDMHSLRTGKIVEWYPSHVRVDVYNDKTGNREKITLPKSMVGIIENPLYSVMNEPNSTMRRLINKLVLLDAIDQQSGSGRLDVIIRLPYTIKSAAREKQAEKRRQAIEKQLSGSRYGIAYMDATENITQLNRPSQNNLLAQIEYLTKLLYSELGITDGVFNGTANQTQMSHYYDRTVEPIVLAIVEELTRKFLTKTARSQHQTIMAFRDVLRLLPADEMAKLVDSLSRNEIVTSNELRSVLGLKPSKDKEANELKNKNMPDDSKDSGLSRRETQTDEAVDVDEDEKPSGKYDKSTLYEDF